MAIEIKDGFEEEVVETPEESKEAAEENASAEEIPVEESQEDAAEDLEEDQEPDTETEEPEESAEEDQGASGEDPQEAPKAKKGLFGKKKEKKDPRDEKIEELTDLLKRNMAEFDNFRKRTDKEKSAMYEIGARSIIEKLLPVVDNFERGLATVSEEDKEKDSFANGMDMVYKQILKLFEDLDVKVIETEGQEFDPNLHNAVMHIEDENLGENVIAQEFQKGYTYKGTVIRHSMVQVAN